MDFVKFKALLDEQMSWPDYYFFKFIVPQKSVTSLLSHFSSDSHVEQKESKNGNYISVTVRCLVHNSDEIIKVYQDVKDIEGLMSL